MFLLNPNVIQKKSADIMSQSQENCVPKEGIDEQMDRAEALRPSDRAMGQNTET